MVQIEKSLRKSIRDSIILFYTQVAGVLFQIIVLTFVGQLGSSFDSAVAGFGVSWTNITVLFPIIGASMFILTSVSQETGKKNYEIVFSFLYKSFVINLIFAFIIIIFNCNSRHFFTYMNLHPDQIEAASSYVIASSLYSIPLSITAPCMYLLTAQLCMVPLIYAYTLGIIIDAVAAYVFIYKLNYGILAAPWIIVATYAFEAFFMLLFIYKSNKEVIRKCRHFPRRSDFNFFCTTLKDSIMTSLMVVIEFSGAQLNLIMSSYLSEAMTSAFTTMFLVEVLAWIVGFSLSNVVALKVGKHLGTKKTHKVSKFGRRAFTFALAGAILYMVPMIVLKNRLGSFFFTDPEVVKIVGEIVPYIILAAVLDILQVTLGNILRVFGWFTRAIVTSLVGFYVVGVPLSILLAFYFDLEDQGLFLSYSCALFIQSVVYITFVSTIRVEDEIERIAKNYKTIPQTDSPYVPLSAHSSYTEHKELADS